MFAPKKKLRFAIPRRKEGKVIGQKTADHSQESPKSIKILSISRGEDLVKISVKNTSPFDLKNVVIRVYESHGFFGKDMKVKKLLKWAPNEVSGLEFKPELEKGMRYLLKIEDEEDTLKIKRI